MKLITEKQMPEEIERQCKRDLGTLVKRNEMFPREAWVNMVVAVVEKTAEDQWEDHKLWLRDRAKAGGKFAEDIEKICTASRERDFIETKSLKALAQSLRNSSEINRQILRKNRRSNDNQTLTVLMHSILRRNEKFDCWKALASVLQKAYSITGRAKDIRALEKALLRAARQYRKGVTT